MSESFPIDKKLCIGVTIAGPGIDSRATSYGALKGISKGFVTSEDNAEVALDVPRGSDRVIDLYYYAQNLSSPCPSIVDPEIDFSKIFNIGHVENVRLEKAIERIEIALAFPGLANNIVTTLGLPASCVGGAKGASPVIGTLALSLTIQQTAAGIAIHSRLSNAALLISALDKQH